MSLRLGYPNGKLVRLKFQKEIRMFLKFALEAEIKKMLKHERKSLTKSNNQNCNLPNKNAKTLNIT